jgi:hypothetical protein
MTPDMGPYIATAWFVSLLALSTYTGFVLWRFQNRER